MKNCPPILIYPLVFVRGDTPDLDIQYTDATTGLPIDIAGAAIEMTCKNDPDQADPGLFQLTVGAGITITDSANGKFSIVVPTSATQGLSCLRSYLYDLVVKPVAGGRDTLFAGPLTLWQNVTGF
jgi:hypothetical protein